MTNDDPLSEYREKRDFSRTGEPAGEGPGGEVRTAEHPMFVVQKHDATSLHYDLRLELDGVLKSWAVPKGPSLDPREKRLAVMTEDHPLEYASFEGLIPEGEYGGGTVMVWDTGWWEPDLLWGARAPRVGAGAGATARTVPESTPSPAESLAKGELKFILHGTKLTGSWVLVQMKGRGIKNWLLIKHRDEAARDSVDITESAPDSVVTGRSLDQITATGQQAPDATAASGQQAPGPAAAGSQPALDATTAAGRPTDR